jgi:predicted ArsR family transcriptional regulator
MTFKVRSETVALLMFMRTQDDPATASELAVPTNMEVNGLRKRLNRLHGEGYIAREQRYVPIRNTRAKIYYYWLSSTGDRYLASRSLDNITPITKRPRQRAAKRIANSVFALGAL